HPCRPLTIQKANAQSSAATNTTTGAHTLQPRVSSRRPSLSIERAGRSCPSKPTTLDDNTHDNSHDAVISHEQDETRVPRRDQPHELRWPRAHSGATNQCPAKRRQRYVVATMSGRAWSREPEQTALACRMSRPERGASDSDREIAARRSFSSPRRL